MTRVRLKDGTTLLLGLPQAYQTSPEDIVEQTMVLDAEDVQQRCEESLEPGEYIWRSSRAVGEETTKFVINATPWPETADETTGERTATSSPTDPYCELVFTDQWWLNLVRPVGLIEPTP